MLNRLDVYKEREDELVPTRHNAVSIYTPRLNEHENNVDDFDVEVNNYDDFVARFHEKQSESNSAWNLHLTEDESSNEESDNKSLLREDFMTDRNISIETDENNISNESDVV